MSISLKFHFSYLVVVLFSFYSSSIVHAQCDPVGALPSTSCEDAQAFCFINTCYTTTQVADQGHPAFCGPNSLVHNPQYFLFTASSDTVQIDIVIDTCSSGAGLQAAIIDINNTVEGCDTWTPDDVVDCDPNFGEMASLVMTNAVVGNHYLLLIDGSNAATCTYTFTYAEGIVNPALEEDLETIAMDPQACPGDTAWSGMVSPAIDGAHGYIWSGLPGGTVTSPTATLDYSTPGFDGIPIDAFPGFYTVCVVPYSSCDTGTALVCFNLQIVRPDSATLDPESHCQEDYNTNSVYWGDLLIPTPGEYSQTVLNDQGCAIYATRQFLEFPETGSGVIDTLHCGRQLIYEGQIYSSNGTYPLNYPGGNVYGCDSFAELNLTLISANGGPRALCVNDTAFLDADLDFIQQPGTEITHSWFDTQGNLVSTEATWMPVQGGLYFLRVEMSGTGYDCSFGPWSIALPDQYIADCSACGIVDLIVEQGPCDSLGWYELIFDMELDNAAGQFILEGNGDPYGTYSYSDLPIMLGPFDGNILLAFDLQATDVLNPDCSSQIETDLFDCIPSSLSRVDKNTLDIRYSEGHAFFRVPEVDMQLSLFSITGRLLYSSDAGGIGSTRYLEDVIDHNGIVIVVLESDNITYVGKAVMVN